MTPGQIQAWLGVVHDQLTRGAVDLAGAMWGPARMRHRTRRPDWFAPLDRSWARPLDADLAGGEGTAGIGIELVTASFADLPATLAPPPIRHGDLGPRGEVIALAGSPVRMVWSEHGGNVIAWDRESGRALVLLAEAPNGYETVSPFRFLVHWAVTASGGLLVHGASVGRREGDAPPRGLMLLGDAGFGKSTSTLAALERGWVTCGDDAVALCPDDEGWCATAVYAAVKTKLGPGEGVLAGLDVVTWDIHGRKRAHLLTETDGRHLVHAMRIDGLVVLAPDADPESPWVPVSPATARSLGAPSTTIPLPYDRDAALGRFGELATALPAALLPRRRSLDATVGDLAAILEWSRPFVSVVIPVYNGSRFVTTALASVLAQSGVRFDVVVVDDASTDPSVEVIEGMRGAVEGAGHGLRIIRHGANAGVAAARNTGIHAAEADLIGFLDQDDEWRPGHTRSLLTALARNGADAAFGRMAFSAIVPEDRRSWMRPEWFGEEHRGSVVGAAIVRRTAFAATGLFPEDNSSGTDDVFWLMRLRDSGLMVIDTDRVVLERRMHEANQSRGARGASADLLEAVREHRRRQSPTPLDVVIPVHGTARYLEACVRSALAQEGVDPRVIVVDDGCDVDLAALAAAWGDPRVRVVAPGTHRGAGAARNTGARLGAAPWLAFLDADDLWPRGRSRTLLVAAGDPAEAVLVYGSQVVFDDGTDPDPAASFDVEAGELAPLMGTALVSRSAFDLVGGFDEDLTIGEAVDWLARARFLGLRQITIRDVTLLRRSHASNTSRTRDPVGYLAVVRRARARAAAGHQPEALTDRRA